MKGILVIDDNHDYLEMMSVVLSKDYKVFALSSLEGLINFSEEERISCVILDFNIGLTKAVDFLPVLDQKKNLKGVPRILITGSIDIDVKIRELDFSRFLSKPFSNKELRNIIEELID